MSSLSKRSLVQLGILALLALALALIGQASMVRGTLQGSAAQAGVGDRSVADDNGVLPGKPGVRAQAVVARSRTACDHDPPPFIIGSLAEATPLPSSGGAWWVVHHEAAPQPHGLAYLPRGPPTEQWLNDDRVSCARVAAFRSVDSFLPLRHGAPSRMMA